MAEFGNIEKKKLLMKLSNEYFGTAHHLTDEIFRNI